LHILCVGSRDVNQIFEEFFVIALYCEKMFYIYFFCFYMEFPHILFLMHIKISESLRVRRACSRPQPAVKRADSFDPQAGVTAPG
jgi:hypothetical protein